MPDAMLVRDEGPTLCVAAGNCCESLSLQARLALLLSGKGADAPKYAPAENTRPSLPEATLDES